MRVFMFNRRDDSAALAIKFSRPRDRFKRPKAAFILKRKYAPALIGKAQKK